MTAHIESSALEAAKAHRPEIRFENHALLAALAACNGAIETRNTTPILGNVRILARNGSAYITGTDLDMELTAVVPAHCDAVTGFTLPARALLDFAKKAPKGCVATMQAPAFGPVTRTRSERVDGESVVVKYEAVGQIGPAEMQFGAIRYKLDGLPVSDFPKLPGIEYKNSFFLPGMEAREMLESVAFAISQEETRYYLNGVFLHIAESGDVRRLVAVATDGHRLARWQGDVPEGAEGMPGVIIPRKAVALLLKLWRGKACPETVAISVHESRVKVTWPGFSLISKVIDGTFPDYHRVIPTSNRYTMRGESNDLKSAIDAASAVSSERGRAVKLVLGGDAAEFAVNNPDGGSSSACASVVWDGDDFKIGFNAQYLLDVIKVACPGKSGGPIVMEMQDSGAPVRITGSNPACDFVQMPMRV